MCVVNASVNSFLGVFLFGYRWCYCDLWWTDIKKVLFESHNFTLSLNFASYEGQTCEF